MKIKFKLYLIISIFFCNLLNAQNSNAKIKELFDAGYYYFYYDDYKKAIKYFEKVLEIDSNHYNANFYIGLSLGTLERYQECFYYLDKKILLDSTDKIPFILSYKGSIYFDIGDYIQSIKYLTRSLEMKPKDDNFSMRGKASNRIGEFNNAIKDFNQAIIMGDNTPEVYFERACAYFLLNIYDKAATDFIRSRELGCKYVQLDYYLGEIFFEYQYYQKAISYFEKYIHVADDDLKRLQSAFRTGVSYYFLSDYKESLKYLNLLQRDEPEYLGAFLYKGMTYLALGDLDNSRNNLEKVLTMDSSHRQGLLQMGNLEFQTKNIEKANNYFKRTKYLSEMEKDELVLFSLFKSYILIGDTMNAYDCLDKIISFNPKHFKAIDARIALNRHTKPIHKIEIFSDYDLLIELFKDSAKIKAFYIANKAVSLIEFGQFDEGLMLLDTAISIHSFSEYIALKAYIRSYNEYILSQKNNNGKIPLEIQEQILKDMDIVLKSDYRKMDAYLIKTAILIIFKRSKEACESANEAIKLGAIINKNHLKFICKGNAPKNKKKNNEWEFFYNLSSFEERFL